MSFYEFARKVLTFSVPLYYKLEYRGLDKVPDGGFLLCCNHVSFLDPILLAIKIRPQLRFMAKIELFRIPVLRTIIKWLGAFPVARGSGDMTPINTSAEIINSGGSLLIFPEGTRSKTGGLLRARSGAALVAMKTGANVVPASIRFEHKGRFRSKIFISFGDVIQNAELKLDPDNIRSLPAAAKYIMERIKTLWESSLPALQ